MPKVECNRFKKFYNDINPKSLSIIFPTTYMNNPASMFGHTLIRINKKNADKTNSELNSITINYGADTKGEISEVIFAFKGVFGLYKGFFSATQYYKLSNNYNYIENRDIWEYKLNFTEENVKYYTKHVWELIFTDSNYYFFQKNCSYYILETLNILTKDVDLTSKFHFYTAPIDTIRLLQKQGLIIDNNYRPSLQKQIKNQQKYLSREEKKSVKNILNNKKSKLKMQKYMKQPINYYSIKKQKIKSI